MCCVAFDGHNNVVQCCIIIKNGEIKGLTDYSEQHKVINELYSKLSTLISPVVNLEFQTHITALYLTASHDTACGCQ